MTDGRTMGPQQSAVPPTHGFTLFAHSWVTVPDQFFGHHVLWTEAFSLSPLGGRRRGLRTDSGRDVRGGFALGLNGHIAITALLAQECSRSAEELAGLSRRSPQLHVSHVVIIGAMPASWAVVFVVTST
jgi:hypothetical protein